ncbi:MAG TPA: hypothetical protein ENH92_03690 [Ectothiorhodospiraceae bacterium]|nr:hypothetical protein [Ectothiorhodospiraceae bacterium]
MKQLIKDFETNRKALEKLLNGSAGQLTKKAAQLSKKKMRFSKAAKDARTKKAALVADIAKKSTAAKTKRLTKLNETIQNSAAEAKSLNVELQPVKAELKEVKTAQTRYTAGFKQFDKAITSHDKAVAKKATKKPVMRRAKKKVPAKK